MPARAAALKLFKGLPVSRPGCRGFTMVELLVVMTIIAVLAGLVLSVAGYVQKKGARARAESEIAGMSAALESYKVDNGEYPVDTSGNPTNSTGASNTNLVPSLMPPTGRVYFEFSKGMTNRGTNTATDPFGDSYGYYFDPTNSTYTNLAPSNQFLLWSKAGASQTNQWVKNW